MKREQKRQKEAIVTFAHVFKYFHLFLLYVVSDDVVVVIVASGFAFGSRDATFFCATAISFLCVLRRIINAL